MPTALRQQAYPFGSLRKDPHWSVQGLVFYSQFSPARMLFDELPYGNHGTIIGPTWVGNGLDFADESSDSVDIPAASNRFPTDDLSIVVIINARTTGGASSGRIISFANVVTTTLEYSGSRYSWRRGTDGTDGSWRTALDVPGFNVMEHVVLTQSGLSQPKLYINGHDIAIPELTGPTGNITSIDNRIIRIGNNYPTSIRSFDGRIFYIALYARVLSAGEAQQLNINPNLLMQQPPIWLFKAPAVVGFKPYWALNNNRLVGAI